MGAGVALQIGSSILARSVPRPDDRNQEILAEFVARLQVLNYSPNTIRLYRWSVKKLLHTFPSVPLEMMTAEHIERHVYARPVGPRTKGLEIRYIRAFFKYLVKNKRLLKENPCGGVDLPLWKERLRPAPRIEEVEAVLRQARSLDEAVMVEMYYFCGLRLRELLALRHHHVDLAQREIRILRAKGEKDRVVIFPERTQVLLNLFMRGAPDDWLFPSPIRRGHPRSHETVNATLRRLGQAAGLPYRLTSHLLRHGFVRLCKVRGLSLDVAAKLLGHANILTTSKLYGRLDVSDLKTAYDERINPTIPPDVGPSGGWAGIVRLRNGAQAR